MRFEPRRLAPRAREALRHPFWQAVALLAGSFLLFEFGIAYLPPLVGIKSAPIPNSVLVQYMLTALVGILLYVGDNEVRWRQFKEPIHAALVDADKKWVRAGSLVLLPLLVGFVTYRTVRPSMEAGAQLRSIHPAPPGTITFRGKTLPLAGLENPLRSSGDSTRHLALGRRVYYANCLPCHGDRFDGQGHYAHAFNPAPLSFADHGTIAQLQESYVFWRIAKGGPGLPREGAPWNSAMPAWEDFLTEDEIWSVIMYLYQQTGWRPRTWDEEGGAPVAGSGDPQGSPEPDETGRAVYEKWCAGCHGDEGRGDGPAATHLLPKPRDLTPGVYEIRSTATGELPLHEDVRRVVDEGMPGTSMPEWRTVLSGPEREAVVGYVESFSPAFASARPQALGFGRDPGGGQAAVDSGRALYRRIECWKCHGEAGRGDGQSAPRLKDDLGNPVRATDLTQNWLFNGGGTVRDIYRALRTGLDGTPMPSFSDLIEGNVVSDADLWRVATFVRSLSPQRPPRVRDAVRADLIEGVLPSGPEDSVWARAERFYLPLVGQVVVRPRNFAPTVSGVFVQAVHNGSALAIRVSWNDPSRSPDTVWNVWRSRMARAMADDSVPYDTSGALPDRLAIQFPTRRLEGMERPYFLMGSSDKPVYLWDWQSTTSGAVEALARGVDRVEPATGLTDTLSAAATYNQGEWRVQLVRALITADSTNRLQFVAGRAIPMAVFARDGSNSEAGARMAVGSWNALYLAEPARASTYLWPIAAVLITAGLGLLVTWQARRTASRRAIEPQVVELA